MVELYGCGLVYSCARCGGGKKEKERDGAQGSFWWSSQVGSGSSESIMHHHTPLSLSLNIRAAPMGKRRRQRRDWHKRKHPNATSHITASQPTRRPQSSYQLLTELEMEHVRLYQWKGWPSAFWFKLNERVYNKCIKMQRRHYDGRALHISIIIIPLRHWASFQVESSPLYNKKRNEKRYQTGQGGDWSSRVTLSLIYTKGSTRQISSTTAQTNTASRVGVNHENKRDRQK